MHFTSAQLLGELTSDQAQHKLLEPIEVQEHHHQVCRYDGWPLGTLKTATNGLHQRQLKFHI